jgi:hypothetical protein
MQGGDSGQPGVGQAGGPRRPEARIGDIKPYNQQGRAIWVDGKRVSEHEHLGADINWKLQTTDPSTGTSPWDDRVYRRSPTLTIPEDMARVKTRKDMELRDQIKQSSSTGMSDALAENVRRIESDIQRTIDSRDETIRARQQAGKPIDDLLEITDEKINWAAHLQGGELHTVGKSQASPEFDDSDIEHWAEVFDEDHSGDKADDAAADAAADDAPRESVADASTAHVPDVAPNDSGPTEARPTEADWGVSYADESDQPPADDGGDRAASDGKPDGDIGQLGIGQAALGDARQAGLLLAGLGDARQPEAGQPQDTSVTTGPSSLDVPPADTSYPVSYPAEDVPPAGPSDAPEVAGQRGPLPPAGDVRFDTGLKEYCYYPPGSEEPSHILGDGGEWVQWQEGELIQIQDPN